MHKKLEADLVSLAHSILKMKNKDDVNALKDKAKLIYEKLSVLSFVDDYLAVNPQLKDTKEELIEKVDLAFETIEKEKKSTVVEDQITEEKIVHNLIDEKETQALTEKVEEVKEEPILEKVDEEPKVEAEKKSTEIEQPFEELESIMFGEPDTATNFKNDVKDVGERKTPTLDDELQDTISVDVMAEMFENAQPKSLNDKFAKNISIGLNDRIAFVKHLFNNQQEDYNRVVNQLNSFTTEQEAKTFVNTVVKPDYNWEKQEELESRFFEIIERKFS